MNEGQLARLKQFANDRLTMEAVKHKLLDSFLRKRADQDVHLLAGSRIAIDNLMESFKEIEGLRQEKSESEQPTNIGL